MADHAAALSAHELQRIGILLLRHQAAAGRGSIREIEERKFLGGEENEILAEPAEMNHAERRSVKEGGHEIAIAADVDAVPGDPGKAEGARDRAHIDRVAGPRDGAGPERQFVGFAQHRG